LLASLKKEDLETTRCPRQTEAWQVDRQGSRTEEEEEEGCGNMVDAGKSSLA
jgi:hypothetical protein